LQLLKSQPIRRQIVTVTLLLIVPFAIAVGWSADRTLRERETELKDQAGAIAATAAAYLNQYLSAFDSAALVLARHPAVVTLDRSHTDQLFAGILREQPLLLNIVLTDRDGTVMGSALGSRGARGPLVALPYVKEVVAQRKPVVSELTTGQVSGKPTIILGYPVFDGDRVVGAIGLGINLAALQSVFNSIPLPEGSVITVTDSASRVLARSRDSDKFIGTAADPNAVPPSEVAATQVRTGLDGIPRFYGNTVIARGPWLLSVGIPTTVAVARVTPLWRRNLVIVVAAVMTILGLSLLLSHALGRSLSSLRLAAQRIAAGDLSPPARTRVPNLEIAELQEAFITMAASLRTAQDALDHQIAQERKTREMLQSLQRQVVRQERLAAVGVLVSGVAHELNNPLQAILGTLELLERQKGLSADVLEEIAFVKTQSGRAREIIRNLSRFSSQQSGPPTLVDLREVIDEVVQLRRRDLSNLSIALDVEVPGPRHVYANFTELEQVTLNFVINAQQSIESIARPGGRIVIRLLDSGRNVRVEVQDDGPGVSAEDEPKLFQPFFTTKPVGKGTGLGLSVSYGIVDSYGGTIGHSGNPWGGATFFFELPAANTASPSASDDRTSLLHGSLRSKL
jgi:C4-dicarboxylate-specific signal transduction histidine kinase